ncbi:Glutathione synthetase [Mucor velutinosus]|uniref:Glutathione synthetase n=1 Tax=Mucor velutinosus TaxID=708070 RepID=A0AAN7DFS1_9FUNG|nr:Glutathione synthetase [Mucor velutinosus]
MLAFGITFTNAQIYTTPPPRRSPSCALLSGKIYCYGGWTGPSSAVKRDTSLYTLDITNVTDNFETKWEEITNVVNANIASTEVRGRAQVAVPSDGKNLLISGGFPYSNHSTTPQHLVFNAETKSWKSLAEFDDGPNGKYRQIYLATATYVPEQSKFYFYGGVENYPVNTWYLDTLTNVNISNPIFASDATRSKIGYYRMTTLDINSGASNPWQIIPQQNPPTIDYYMQSSIYHTSSKKIYYFGGYYNDVSAVGTANLTFQEAIVFDTATSTWGKQAFTGGVIPTVRRYHTMTLLPSGQDVLLYGGTTNDANPSRDFCFVANLETFVWSSCNTIGLPNNGITYRAEHSAVLDDAKKIVYILFGYANDKSVVDNYDTVLALNVSDPKAVAFVDSTQTAKPVESSVPAPVNENGSGGTIGGAVGGAVGGLLVIGLIAFFLMKKKKSEEKPVEEDKEEQLSVDWDAIEGGYTEAYPVSDINTKDIYTSHNKPYEPSVQEQEAMIQFSPAMTNTNTETTAVASINVPDVAIDYQHDAHRGNYIIKPDVAL